MNSPLPPPNRPKILILGGGFAGVRAALDVVKLLPSAKVTLINNSTHHCFHPDLYEVATAKLVRERKIDFQDLEGTVAIPLKVVFRQKPIRVVIDDVVGVDLPKKMVSTRNWGDLSYDFLVVALGGTTAYFGIQGAKKYSRPLKTTYDALNIRNDLDELMSSAKRPLSVVIAGGGFTGVELGAELVNFLQDEGRITLLEGSDRLLTGMPEWTHHRALKKLKKLKVQVLTGHKILEVTSQTVVCDNGQNISFDYLIWTAGVKGQEVLIKGVELTKKGQLPVLSDLSLEKYPEVFVVGDMAECLDTKRNCPVPQAAWAAIGQAQVAVRNISRRHHGQSTASYLPPSPSFVVPVGGKFALSNIFNLKVVGVWGWVLKRLVALKYLLSISPPFYAINMWWRGVRIYHAND